MSDVDQMFTTVVDPWWDRNCLNESPDFDALRDGIASYNALCRHAAWNEVGRWFMRGKGGSEKRELMGLQCLVEALHCSPTNNSAAWSAFRESTRPELTSIQSKLAGLPGPPRPGDSDANHPLVVELETIIGKPGGYQQGEAKSIISKLFGSEGSKSHTRTTPATTRTAALDGQELRRLLAESRLSSFLEKQFAPPEYKYKYVLTPAELCDVADRLGDEVISWRVEKPGRLDSQSDVIVNIKGKSGGIGPTIIGLYTFDSGHYAERVWTTKQILPENLSLESIKGMLDIRDRTAVNFQSGSYSYTPSEMEQVTSSQLWQRLCSHCDTLGIRLT